MNALVIGCGNPLRGDDGVGPQLAGMIARTDASARVLTVHALVPELAPTLADADVVVFLDARSGPAAGRVRHTVVEPEPSGTLPAHGLTPAALLHLARLLYGCGASAHLVTIETESFGFGSELSREARRACPEAARQALDIIHAHAASAPQPSPASR